MTNTNLTEEQKNNLRQLNFYYETVAKETQTLSDNELFNRLLNLDNSLKRKAFIKAFCEGLGGFVLFISGYNMLTHLEHAFLAGIIFFSLGSILLATSYPLYNYLLNKERRKLAPVVLTITKYLG
ncbi:MAG: hypothetical protein K6F66_01700 [Pseudobutyrivibrio sp.]|nr:hypothetical protein [Pseudobutyrivibrio sp.]